MDALTGSVVRTMVVTSMRVGSLHTALEIVLMMAPSSDA